jgi:ATP-dependent DNA helicase RecQ
LARVRPSTLIAMRMVYGIGEKKLADLGQAFLDIILEQCKQHNIALDQSPSPVAPRATPAASKPADAPKRLAMKLFAQGGSIEAAIEQSGRTRLTIEEYLAEFIRETKPADISAWVSPANYDRIAAAIAQVGANRLKPIYITLGETIPYHEIKAVVAHLAVTNARDKPV